MQAVLSTNDVAQAERAAYWCDWVCDVFINLECKDFNDAFYGSIGNRELGRAQISQVTSNQQVVERSRHMIAGASDDYYIFNLQLKGEARVEQDGRRALLQPGDFSFCDSTRRYQLKFDTDFSQLVFKTPRALVNDRLAFSERLTATRVPGTRGMGRVASRFFRAVAAEIDTLEPHEVERVTQSLIDMFSTAVGHDLVSRPVDSTSTRAAQLVRIKMYIVDHLRDPALTPASIAAANGIGVRYLNKLFASEEMTVSRMIWEQRLKRIKGDLIDPELAGRSISELAFGWGFNNMSHFSRTFKARFGASPRDYRAQHLHH